MPSVSVSVSLDQELYRRALTKASGEGTSLDQLMAGWVEDWVGDETLVPSPLLVPAPPSERAVTGTSPQTYIVKAGDSLWLIAQNFYGDGNLYGLIANANHIGKGRPIYAGMRLLVPPKDTIANPGADRDPGPLPPSSTVLPPPPDPAPLVLPKPGVAPKPGYPIVPSGLDQIKAVFGTFTYREVPGKPAGRIHISPQWVTKNIVTTWVPVLGSVQCHRLLAPVFIKMMNDMRAKGLAKGLKSWGAFVPRHKRWDRSKGISVHSWGIAIDLNADTNAQGTAGNMDRRVIQVFAEHGFYWGGNFGDPMHFQYCLEY